MLLLLVACTSSKPYDSSPFLDDSGRQDSSGDDSGIQEEGHYFPAGAPWYQSAESAAVDSSSEQVIGALQAHGWGLGRFQIDFGMEVLEAPAGTEKMSFQPTGDHYTPDCDTAPIPIPEGGAIEAEEAYTCSGDGDCHLLVHSPSERRLYEMWRADIRGETFRGGCLAIWETDRVYPEEGRGEQCTSADAAGYPIAPLLFDADELAAGEIDHAIRFILPNDIIRDGVYFHPATHATNADGGAALAVPYGAHFRLKSDFDMDRLGSDHARVVARALQKYGMFLADGGNVALTARSDRFTEHKYVDLGFDSHALVGIEPQDFEMLQLGQQVELSFECRRTPLSE